MNIIDEHQLPIVKGLHLSLDDSIRGAVIMQIMCEDKIDKKQIQQYFGIIFDDYFESELKALDQLVDDQLIEVDAQLIQVTPTGRFFLRNIAIIFDAYRNPDEDQQRFSKVL